MSRWLLVMLLALVMYATFAHAQSDEDADIPMADNDDAAVEDTTPEDEELMDEEGMAGMAGGVTGFMARAIFPKFPMLKLPAGEKLETLVAVQNVATNPAYRVMFTTAHISPLNDHSRAIQNFSAAIHDRDAQPGETATFKYTLTPSAELEPMDYSFVVRTFFMNADNATFAATAYNGTITLEEPLGVDPKSIFTVFLFGGIAAFVAYFKFGVGAAVPEEKKSSPARERSTSPKKADTSFVSKEHLAYANKLQQKSKERRNRSASK